MKRIEAYQIAALLGPARDAGFGESGTGTLADRLTREEQMELAVVQDQDALDAAVEIGAAANEVAAEFGVGRLEESRTMNEAAHARFEAAREALRVGDRRAAIEEACKARRLIARAVLATGAAEALLALIERIEDLALETGDDDDEVFDDPQALRAELGAISAEARDLLARGDSVRAAERAVLGEQIAHHHRGRRHRLRDIDPDRARLAVSLAGTAVALARRLVSAPDTPARTLGSSDVRDHHDRWLAHAERMLAKAEQALAAGPDARAVHFAEHARWSALKAVILPSGVTEEEIRALVDLAHRLHGEVELAIGDEPAELQRRLFERAGGLIELGEEMLANGHRRGITPTWRGAVICRWLTG